MFLKNALSGLPPCPAGTRGLVNAPQGRTPVARVESMTAFCNQAPVLAWITNDRGQYIYFSPAYIARFGSNALPRMAEGAGEPLPALTDSCLKGSEHPPQAVQKVQCPHGGSQYILVEYFALIGADGARYTGAVGVDVTEQQSQAEDLTRLAMTDELTGLWNRRGFLFLADHELKAARRRRARCAILYIDVDHMKQANDRYGHEEGDLLLRETAVLLRSEFRESDVIGRIGGDEFAVFANDVRDGAEALRERFSSLFRNFPQTAAQHVPLSLSVGAAICDRDEVVELGKLLTLADRSLYEYRDYRARQLAVQNARPSG